MKINIPSFYNPTITVNSRGSSTFTPLNRAQKQSDKTQSGRKNRLQKSEEQKSSLTKAACVGLTLALLGSGYLIYGFWQGKSPQIPITPGQNNTLLAISHILSHEVCFPADPFSTEKTDLLSNAILLASNQTEPLQKLENIQQESLLSSQPIEPPRLRPSPLKMPLLRNPNAPFHAVEFGEFCLAKSNTTIPSLIRHMPSAYPTVLQLSPPLLDNPEFFDSSSLWGIYTQHDPPKLPENFIDGEWKSLISEETWRYGSTIIASAIQEYLVSYISSSLAAALLPTVGYILYSLKNRIGTGGQIEPRQPIRLDLTMTFLKSTTSRVFQTIISSVFDQARNQPFKKASLDPQTIPNPQMPSAPPLSPPSQPDVSLQPAEPPSLLPPPPPAAPPPPPAPKPCVLSEKEIQEIKNHIAKVTGEHKELDDIIKTLEKANLQTTQSINKAQTELTNIVVQQQKLQNEIESLTQEQNKYESMLERLSENSAECLICKKRERSITLSNSVGKNQLAKWIDLLKQQITNNRDQIELLHNNYAENTYKLSNLFQVKPQGKKATHLSDMSDFFTHLNHLRTNLGDLSKQKIKLTLKIPTLALTSKPGKALTHLDQIFQKFFGDQLPEDDTEFDITIPRDKT